MNFISIKKGDIVKVQPMHYCYTFVSGGVDNLLREEDKEASTSPITHHWTGNGFKARILDVVDLKRNYDGEVEVERYVQAKIYGQGRKHFIKGNDEKTKVIWIQERLVSKCRDEKE
jgi:translation initiation factor IF-1